MADSLGYIATALIVLSLTMSSVIRLRVVGLAGSAVFTLYGVVIDAWPVAATNGIITSIHVIHLVRIFMARPRSPSVHDQQVASTGTEAKPLSGTISSNGLGSAEERPATSVTSSLAVETFDSLFASVADTAIEALSCDFGAVVIRQPEVRLVLAPSGWQPDASSDVVLGSLLQLLVDLDTSAPGLADDETHGAFRRSPLGFEAGLVSHCVIPLSVANHAGAIVLAQELDDRELKVQEPQLDRALEPELRADTSVGVSVEK